MKKITAISICLIMMFTLFTGCGSSSTAENEEKVTLTIAGPWEEFPALETVANSFTKENPNCTVAYEYMQDYDETILTRLKSDDNKVDLFLPSNVQKDSPTLPYMVDLSKNKDVDLSDTFDGLVDNFKLHSSDKEESSQFYAVPLFAEVRGMFVNKTLLDSLNIKVPTNQKELLDACEKIKKAGYIPLQGNPGTFGQLLMYPAVCNSIANSDDYEATYNSINNREEGTAEFFEPQMSFLYKLMENDYYKYKYVETELNMFTDMSNEAYAKYFLNILDTGKGEEKQDDVGQVAFMPSLQSLNSLIDKTKDDYHSKIEYEFILSPVGEKGGYAYLSPGRGISINKNTDNMNWSVKFLNYLFESDNNIKLSEEANTFPNTKEVYNIITDKYNIPKDHVSQLGQATFQYDFYSTINNTLVNISKGNNPKYMKDNKELYPLSYYMDQLKEDFNNAK